MSTTRVGEFYPVWPNIEGKNLSLQWGEIRENTSETKAIVRGSLQDLQDGVDDLNSLRALIGFLFGKQGAQNKYRFIYNKTTEEFCCQRNTGTEAVPVWEDVWCVRFSDGQFQVTSEGGIQSNAGFYGPLPHDLDRIGEIRDNGALGGTQFIRPNELYFNTRTGFYLTSVTSGPRAGKPIVNFSFPLGRAKTFAKNGRVWQIDHNFDTSPVMVQTMNDQDVVVIPDKVDVSNRNTAWFYFNEVTSGKALIATGGTGAVEFVTALTLKDGDNGNVFTQVEDINVNASQFYLSTTTQGQPVINLGITEDTIIGGELTLNSGSAHIVLAPESSAGTPEVEYSPGGTRMWGTQARSAFGYRIFDYSDDGGGTDVPVTVRPGAGNSAIVVTGSGALDTKPPGRVGLGTAVPDDKLHVAGRGRFDDRVLAEAFYLEPGSGGGMWKAGEDVVVGASDGEVKIEGGLRVDDKIVAENFYFASGGGLYRDGSSGDVELKTVGGDITYDSNRSHNFVSNSPTAVINLNKANVGDVWRWTVGAGNSLTLTDVEGGSNSPLSFETGAAAGAVQVDSGGVGFGNSRLSGDYVSVRGGDFAVYADARVSRDMSAGTVTSTGRVLGEAFYFHSHSTDGGGGIWKNGSDIVLNSENGNVVISDSRLEIMSNDSNSSTRTFVEITGAINPTDSGLVQERGIHFNPNYTIDNEDFILDGISIDGTTATNADPSGDFGIFRAIQIETTFSAFANNARIADAVAVNFEPDFNSDGDSPLDTEEVLGLNFTPIFTTSGTGARAAATLQAGIQIEPRWNTGTLTTVDLGTVYGVYGKNPSQTLLGASDGTEEMEGYHLVHLNDITAPGTIGSTGIACVYSDLSAGSGKHFLNNNGGAASDFGGGDISNFGSITPASVPSVTGSRGGNAALASLLSALETLGLITDNTT